METLCDPHDDALPRLREWPASRLVHVLDLYVGKELKTSPTYNCHHGEAIKGHVPSATASISVPASNVPVLVGDIGTDRVARDFVVHELGKPPVTYVPDNQEYHTHKPRERVDAP